MHDVFYALADPVRRRLLERLQAHGGQTIRQLRARSAITRQGLAKHLDVLAAAELVVVKHVGREKLHFISTKPFRAIVLAWLAPFVPPPATGQEPIEPRTAPQRHQKPKKGRSRTDSPSGHGKWDPGRETATWDAEASRQAEIRERLRMRDT